MTEPITVSDGAREFSGTFEIPWINWSSERIEGGEQVHHAGGLPEVYVFRLASCTRIDVIEADGRRSAAVSLSKVGIAPGLLLAHLVLDTEVNVLFLTKTETN